MPSLKCYVYVIALTVNHKNKCGRGVCLGPTLRLCLLAIPCPTWQRYVHSQLCRSCSQPDFHTHSSSMLPLHRLRHSVPKPHFSAWPPKRARSVHATSMEQEASISYAESVSLLKTHPCFLPASKAYLKRCCYQEAELCSCFSESKSLLF